MLPQTPVHDPIGRAAILQGYRVVYREAHTLLEELAEATLAAGYPQYRTSIAKYYQALAGRRK